MSHIPLFDNFIWYSALFLRLSNGSVIDKKASEALRECILVLDANTGQNGLQQAKVFKECVNLTAVALTKLDGSAKGAIVLAIAKELGLPVKLVGVGEKMEDLKDFESKEFIKAGQIK